MRRVFKNILLTAIVLNVSVFAFAETVSVEAIVDSREVEVGSSINLSVVINGAQDAQAPDDPSVDGFDARYIGPSRQITIVNGRYSSTTTFNYSLLALKTGAFSIPSLKISVDDVDYQTQPIQITVADSASSNTNSSSAASSAGNSLKDKMFLQWEAPQKQIYVNEKLPVTLRLYVAGIAARDIEYPKIENPGVQMGEYSRPEQYQQVVNGINYDVVKFDTYLFPTREGQLTLGPAKLNCNLLIKKSRSLQQPMGGVFGDDFFNDFFDQAEKRPMTFSSDTVSVDVLPLPSEGKPDNFSGAAGNFEFKVEASPLDVKVGDPVTVRMTVFGNGNWGSIELPRYKEDKNFKAYEPNIRSNQGSKVIEQVMIPLSKDVRELPAISFSYFDSQLKSYKTLTQGPFALHVEDAPEGSAKVIGQIAPEKSQVSEQLGEDIVFIKEDIGSLSPKGKNIYGYFIFWFLIFIGVLVYSVLLMFILRKQRLESDEVYAHRLHAPKNARKDLAAAQQYLQAAKVGEFYDSLFKVMQNYFSKKFRLSAGAVTEKTILAAIENAKLDPSTQDDIRRTFEECDHVRYASGQVTQEQMNNAFVRVEKIIDTVERSVR